MAKITTTEKAMHAVPVPGARCGKCNDRIWQYLDLKQQDIVESWFCNDPKCEHGIFHRTETEKEPDWVKHVKESKDIKDDKNTDKNGHNIKK